MKVCVLKSQGLSYQIGEVTVVTNNVQVFLKRVDPKPYPDCNHLSIYIYLKIDLGLSRNVGNWIH